MSSRNIEWYVMVASTIEGTANAKVETVLGLRSASSDRMESEKAEHG